MRGSSSECFSARKHLFPCVLHGLSQRFRFLQAAADSAAIAEATERHARQAELKNAHDHVETLLEQLRIKNEAVDVLEQVSVCIVSAGRFVASALGLIQICPRRAKGLGGML